MRKHVIVVGAGAIGRGYLPWVFSPDEYDYTFVEANPRLAEELQTRGKYTTACVRDGSLHKRTVPVRASVTPTQFHPGLAEGACAVFINVGPRHVVSAARVVASLKLPLVLSENDPATVDQVKAATGLTDVFFAVPDVITSNSAPPDLLAEDPLSLVTEDGVMFIDERLRGVSGTYKAASPLELSRQWTAKLYLHNTPHCVAAYLGALARRTYVHEAMQVPEINAIVRGSMTEMLNSLKLKWDIPHDFLEWYADKEIARFCSTLLHDPISRVAREPLRKLELEGRLLGAAQICLSLGFVPENILLGIAGALLFDDAKDPDHHLAFMRRALSPAALLTHVLSLRKGEALEVVLEQRLAGAIERLSKLKGAA